MNFIHIDERSTLYRRKEVRHLIEQQAAVRLQIQAQRGEDAAAALRCCEVLFPAMREEIYRQMEDDHVNSGTLRQKLLLLRSIEERLAAFVRSGSLANQELLR